jgi:hypothetical protein
LTLNIALSFSSRYAGTQSIYMRADDNAGSSGWQVMGSWTVPSGSGLSSIQHVLNLANAARPIQIWILIRKNHAEEEEI